MDESVQIGNCVMVYIFSIPIGEFDNTLLVLWQFLCRVVHQISKTQLRLFLIYIILNMRQEFFDFPPLLTSILTQLLPKLIIHLHLIPINHHKRLIPINKVIFLKFLLQLAAPFHYDS